MTLNQYIKQLLSENVERKKAEYEKAFDAYTRYVCDWALNSESEKLYEEMRKALSEYTEAVLKFKEYLRK